MCARAAANQPRCNRVSACRNSSHSARTAAAPAASCGPRPRGAATTRAPSARASSTVPSVLPPSATTTGAQVSAQASSTAGRVRAAFSVGMMIASK